MNYSTIEDYIGQTPLVKMQRLSPEGSVILAKMEGMNPGGSVKDRSVLNMIIAAENEGIIKAGDRLIEATSGNTGIALAMTAAIRGLKVTLVMPESATRERRALMKSYGADLVLTPAGLGMEGAIDEAREREKRGEGHILNQFANKNNPLGHYRSTGPEIWKQTGGEITHFVSAMGTTGTLMGTGRYLKEQNKAIKIIGAQPTEGSSIPGIRKWPEEYLPEIYDRNFPDSIESVSQSEAEETARRLAREEGILGGISAGGNLSVAIKTAKQNPGSVVVTIICDRGDRYLSSGLFD